MDTDQEVQTGEDPVYQVLEMSGLNHRQQLFCRYYVRCFNARLAYQQAYGCAPSTAATQGPRLLQREEIRETVKKLRNLAMDATLLTMEDVVQRYVDIAFADVTQFLSFGPQEVPDTSRNADPDHPTKVVDTVRLRPSHQVDGRLIAEVSQSTTGVRLKLLDPLRALQWLADYLAQLERQRAPQLEDDPLTKSLKEAMERGLFPQTD